MRKEIPLSLAALAAVMSLSYGCARAVAQVKPVTDPNRGPIELVVYADNFAMVRETRKVDLQAGRTRIGIQGVSKSLDQNSVLFSWPGKGDAKVVSSTYDLGIDNSRRLLQRFLGQEVELVYHGIDGKPGERVKGTLEVAEPGNTVIKADGKYIVNPEATIEAPTSTGIVTIPQLSAEVESKSNGPTDLAVTYMTGGLSWSADYTATLSPDADEMGLECWATVVNKTGTDFPEAKISFVAGSPNRAVNVSQDYEAKSMNGSLAMSGAGRPAASPAETNVRFDAPVAMGELYAYPYKSTATIRQDQMNRVRMMGSDKLLVKKVYSIAVPGMSRYYNYFDGNPNRRLTATMGINFVNAEKTGLGLPLPGGSIRFYEPDKGGAPRYIGAAYIGDTPKDAPVSLTLTNVFDVYARAKQVSAQKVDKKHTRRTVEITLNNEKSRPVELRLVQGFEGSWRIETESAKSQKLNAYANQWTVKIPAGGETKLRYSVVFG